MNNWNFETAARTIWQEARGEPDNGRYAVAYVILNRLKTGKWGKTLSSVCLWPRQFSGWNDIGESQRIATTALQDNDADLEKCRAVLQNAMEEFPEGDITKGAQYYYAPKAMPVGSKPPSWVIYMDFVGEFGTQLFYRPKDEPK